MNAGRNSSIIELPKPVPPKARHPKLIVVTLLSVVLVCGALFWLTRDEQTRTEILTKIESTKAEIKTKVESVIRDTPLESVWQIFNPPPPPLPDNLTNPPTDPGTLAGQIIQGIVLPPLEPGENPADGQNGVPMAPKVQEDSVVRPLFVEDLATWMVSRYQPGKEGGTTAGVQSANLRYGTELKGTSYSGGDILKGREGLLRYAFTPVMLEALYHLYVERFVEHLGTAAQQKGLTPSQTDAMYRAYAARFTGLANTLEGVAATPDLAQKLDSVEKEAKKALDIHTQMAEAVFALDQARDGGSRTQMEAAQLRVDGLNAKYRKAMTDRAAAQQALVNLIRSHGGAQPTDEDTVFFVANWIARRQVSSPQTLAAARKGVQLMRDLSGRLQQAGSVAR